MSSHSDTFSMFSEIAHNPKDTIKGIVNIAKSAKTSATKSWNCPAGCEYNEETHTYTSKEVFEPIVVKDTPENTKCAKGIAGLLSFVVPGTGQIFKGQSIKGMCILLAYIFCFTGMVNSPFGSIWVTLTIVIEMFAVLDAVW